VALSRVLFRMERYEAGETLLRNTTAAGPARALRCFLLGNFAVKRSDPAAAAAEFRRCLDVDPTFAPSYNNLGVIAAAEGRCSDSSRYFLQAIAIRPEYADPRDNLEALRQNRLQDLRYTFAPLRSVLRPV
jgi:tetratricopeptide (TPR) repeat protein